MLLAYFAEEFSSHECNETCDNCARRAQQEKIGIVRPLPPKPRLSSSSFVPRVSTPPPTPTGAAVPSAIAAVMSAAVGAKGSPLDRKV
jgi:hypothetical protein